MENNLSNVISVISIKNSRPITGVVTLSPSFPDLYSILYPLKKGSDEVLAGEPFSDVESVKAVSDVNSPVTGVVEEVNEGLADAPEQMNEDPYEAWFVKVGEISAQVELLDAEEYEAFTETEA